MTDETALLAAAQTDSTARLVYADCLDERGKPLEAALQRVLAEPHEDRHRLDYAAVCERNGDSERAEFIRNQVWLWANPACGSCTGPEWSAGKPCVECKQREERRGATALQLFARVMWIHFVGAATDIIPDGARWDDHTHFARGFIDEVTCTAADWLAHGDAIRAQHPLVAVTLTTLFGATDMSSEDGEWWFTSTPDHKMRNVEYNLKVSELERSKASSPARLAALVCRWPGVTFTLPS